jgi:uncharacterized membrane protein YcjF (UPF0283 family)
VEEKMKKQNEEKKMTLEEYQQKYSHPENLVAAKNFLFMFGAAIGVVVAVSLFFVVLRLFDIHQIAGYAGSIVAVIIFIFVYVVPVVKLKNTKSFVTNVDSANARQAQKFNKRLREEIADKMIDVTTKTDVIGWYSDELVGKLAIARHTGNDKELKSTLTKIYQTDVKQAANKMIKSSAVKVGITTAISQSELVDTLFVIVYEFTLIKDIVYLYGYRPTDSQMVKIYKNVITNALIAYGLSSATIGMGRTVGSGITSAIEKVSRSGNFIASTLGSIAGVAIESGIQLVVNSTLTVLIGNQTKRYLVKEYNLQDILDDVELIDNEEEEELIEAVKEELKQKMPKKTKNEKKDFATS